MINRFKKLSFSALLALGLSSTAAYADKTSFIGLGDLAGGSIDSFAYGVSADGSTVVGTSSGENGSEAFIWDKTNGMRGIGDLAGGFLSSSARAISGDGSTVVGSSRLENGTEAFIWDEINGMQRLYELLSGQGID